MANITLFSGQCAIEYCNQTSSYLPYLPFDFTQVNASNISSFTLTMTLNGNTVMTDKAGTSFYGTTGSSGAYARFGESLGGGPRAAVQLAEASNGAYGVRTYDYTNTLINFTTEDTVTITLVGPEEYSGVTILQFANIKQINMPVHKYEELEYIYFNGNCYLTPEGDNAFSVGRYREIIADLDSSNENKEFALLGAWKFNGERLTEAGLYNDYTSGGTIKNKLEVISGVVSSAAEATHTENYFGEKIKYCFTVGTGTYESDGTIDGDNDRINYPTYLSIKDMDDTTLSYDTGSSYKHPDAVFGVPWLMAQSVSSTITTTMGYKFTAGKVYKYQVRETNSSGTLLVDLVPARRKSDNRVGMYDKISDTFIPMWPNNAVTTGSAAGPVVDRFPAWCKEIVEVIEIQDYYNNALRTLWEKPSSPTPGPAPEPSDPWATPSVTWTVGTGVTNSDGFTYYPITATGEQGVKINIASTTNPVGSDGKWPSNGSASWKLAFPAVGWYQMVMTFGVNGNGSMNLKNYYHVGVNSDETAAEMRDQIYSELPGYGQGGPTDGVATVIALVYIDSLSEVTITLRNQTGYRLIFNTTADIEFRNITYTPSA